MNSVAFEVTMHPPPPKVRVIKVDKEQSESDRRAEIQLMKVFMRRYREIAVAYARELVLVK